MSTGSGAGLNRITSTILTIQSTAAANSSPLSGSYGVLGVNDSGLCLPEARDYTKWTISMVPVGTTAPVGFQVTMYGTNDPLAYAQWKQSLNPGQYPGGVATVPTSSWFVLPAPSEQSGTGPVANPLTTSSPLMQYSGPLAGIRAVLTTVGTAGAVKINVEVVP